MSSRDRAPGTTAETEKAFMQALRRVASGNPREERNVKLAAKGRLRVTIATVAREVGRSRTLIGSEECAYLDVRKAVLKAMDGGGATDTKRSTAAELVGHLREDKAQLEHHVRVLATRLHDAFLHTIELQERCTRLEDDLASATGMPPETSLKPKDRL